MWRGRGQARQRGRGGRDTCAGGCAETLDTPALLANAHLSAARGRGTVTAGGPRATVGVLLAPNGSSRSRWGPGPMSDGHNLLLIK